jgi:sugar phosphate isomerase/epimerase
MNVFCQLVKRIDHPNFGVNYDPSNTYLAGENPIELLKRVSDRVVTMHASDRYLKEGTIEDLRKKNLDWDMPNAYHTVKLAKASMTMMQFFQN